MSGVADIQGTKGCSAVNQTVTSPDFNATVTVFNPSQTNGVCVAFFFLTTNL